MREIEFRAKGINFDGWIIGAGVYYADNNWWIIVDANTETDKIGSGSYAVIPETLGQYIGLKDKNSKKIFEGDIVKLRDTNYNYEWTAVVEFGNPNSEYIWGWNLKPITKNVEYNLDILFWVEMPFGTTCEVIGNIYDNPELLGE